MATDVKLPRLGQGMESGTIVRWLKAEGDPVKAREPLYELDTDKVTQEVEAEVDGVLREILVHEGETDVGTTIAVIETDAASSTTADPASDEAENVADKAEPVETTPEPAEPTPAPVEPTPEPVRSDGNGAAPEAPEAAPGARIKASPLARRIARERGLELSAITGTGPEGRILAEDVEQAKAGAAAPAVAADASAPSTPGAEVEVIELTSIRKTIARRLTDAWAAPVFQLSVSIDMSETLHLREQLVARLADGDVKPTVNDLLTKLVGVALVQHRAVNATFAGDEIHRYPAAHVGMAVAAPNGLVVPVIRDADRRSVQEIARARADLVERARSGKLTLPDMEGGTFTISNLGMYGMEQFVAVLNPPQAAILAVGSTESKPVVRDGQIEVRPLMMLTLTCDHRAIDGADGAEFLRTVKELLEEPALAL